MQRFINELLLKEGLKQHNVQKIYFTSIKLKMNML